MYVWVDVWTSQGLPFTPSPVQIAVLKLASLYPSPYVWSRLSVEQPLGILRDETAATPPTSLYP